MKNIKILLFLLIAVVSLSAFKCNKSSGGYDKSDWWTGSFSTKNPKRTPNGATVYSYETVTAENLKNIDEGLNRVFDISSRVYGYQNGLNFSDYKIILFKRSALCTGTAIGFAVRADNYDGSEYDKDPRPGYGVVCAAGLSAEFDQPLAVIVQDDSMIALATRFEGEHLILYKNDIQKWGETLTHTTGGHPLLPDTDGSFAADDELLRGSNGRIRGITIKLPEEMEIESETEKYALPKGAKVCLMLTR